MLDDRKVDTTYLQHQLQLQQLGVRAAQALRVAIQLQQLLLQLLQLHLCFRHDEVVMVSISIDPGAAGCQGGGMALWTGCSQSARPAMRCTL